MGNRMIAIQLLAMPRTKRVGDDGRWSVRIMGDTMPMASGLTEPQAESQAISMMDYLSTGPTQWDCFSNIANDDRAYILFRMN